MKVLSTLSTLILLTGLFSCTAEKRNPLEGTWQLVSQKVTESDSTTESTPDEFARSLKIINKTHFASVTQDTSKQTSFFNAGTYRFDKDTYTENVEFFPSFTDFIGRSFSYKIVMEGDQFTMSGPLQNEGESEFEWHMEEVWKKVK